MPQINLHLSNILLLSIFALMTISCESKSEAQKIIDQAIEAHGGELYEKARISFDFRDRHYEIFKSPERFEYSREFVDSIGTVKDVLNNDGFIRTVNGKVAILPEERVVAFSNSVNSVAYFAYLPYGLNDPAVFKSYLGETEIEGGKYHLIKVTFSAESGGKDHEDEFLYWVNQNNFQVDYLAYSYLTDGGGVRFRKAIESRMVEGILIQDYKNYSTVEKSTSIMDLEELYSKGELEWLSDIILENVKVTFP
jgi:hypothetical protein